VEDLEIITILPYVNTKTAQILQYINFSLSKRLISAKTKATNQKVKYYNIKSICHLYF